MTGLSGRRILVIEDEYMLADEVRIELEARAAMVLGPVGRLDQALALIRATPDIDGPCWTSTWAANRSLPPSIC